MEVRDILARKLKEELDLEMANHAVSDLVKREVEKALLTGIPFQYQLEKSEFYNHDFFVNKSVLIPRQETEYLVDLIVTSLRGKIKKVLDIGTGSGVILFSLLAHGTGDIGIGVDISEDALTVAEVNRKRLKLENKVKLIKSDLFTKVDGTFDLIVSNPPYIKKYGHRDLVHGKVHEFEPHLALYLDDEKYDEWFNHFFSEVHRHLEPDGLFYMEGHEKEVKNQAEKLKSLGFQNVSVLQDLTGSDRFLRAQRIR